ncbi:ATPase family [mine drainage metagenome]|uniref:ATPase family n=1 Tax=mine drainage metagenome TaxID=410659 RepID=A0A1J5U2U8_9ZZZZ
MSDFNQAAEGSEAKRLFGRLRDNMRLSIKGKDDVIDQVLIGLASGGHVLIEDLPGLGKTTLAYALARSMDCEFSRIQFTSDLLPGDLTGVGIYDEARREFVFKKGPVFANIVLADEINRATPRTQSALLEVMDRAHVTVDGVSHAVGEPFMVFATQNPADREGAFPLPESQMDRFFLRIHMGYPAEADEIDILRTARIGYDSIPARPVATREEIQRARSAVLGVFVEESVLYYIRQIVAATRGEAAFRAGISVRGGLALKVAAQARALLDGRDFVIPDDVSAQAVPVLAHRLALAGPRREALEERRETGELLLRLLASIPPPS